MPSLSPEVARDLEAPIADEELDLALAQSNPRKAPGPDGFTPTYYKTFNDILSPHLLTALNAVKDGQPMLVDWLRAQISLIPKGGKDLSHCSNYRPIALLNADLKLFARILANRLIHHILSPQ